ncbi:MULTISPECIES: DUF2020 domain-containing protein [unclassified Amycolatopsis]|uniref:DUF2020 domain-containing protein n=1 Tax=unclassified Amycolatopsis TaxID=2618356 RepID=UPI0028771C80|nr:MULTISPECIES: DUF2020 domain-containing protein [unclassified Amycolatopsis]MDS0133047.1 DUF2020 domain-containing protein [Amycolatopsis sp. 505]MDS0142128.1 DUF2020 domain-containing protein [Amycolatopsis sp. CM201R]
MRRLVLLAPAVALLAGCSATIVTGTATPSTPTAAANSSNAGGLPPDPEPGATEDCPYLGSEFVAESNGQHVSKVRVSADQPHPACFFYRPDGKVQLTVRVYVGDAKTATALVNKAAPLDSSNPASDPSGWKGGYLSSDDGAVYAVAKGGTAVIATTNQKQSVKARTVVKKAIAALKL